MKGQPPTDKSPLAGQLHKKVWINISVVLMVLATLVFVQGCSIDSLAFRPEKLGPSTQPSQSELIGTWRLAFATQDSRVVIPPLLPYQFFVRFYPDGTCALWTGEKGDIVSTGNGEMRIDKNGVAWGPSKPWFGQASMYHMHDSSKTQSPEASEQMLASTFEGDTWWFYRVHRDLEPGNLP